MNTQYWYWREEAKHSINSCDEDGNPEYGYYGPNWIYKDELEAQSSLPYRYYWTLPYPYK